MTATASSMSRQPGFVSANLHANRDGLRLVNHEQWESVEAFEAIQGDPAWKAEMKTVLELVTSDMRLYDVICCGGGSRRSRERTACP